MATPEASGVPARRRRGPPPWVWAALAALAVACYLVAARPGRPAKAALPDLSGWSLEDLLARLRERGVPFEALPDPAPRPGRPPPASRGAWLTRGAMPREELALLTRFDGPERWRGVVRAGWRASIVVDPPEEQERYGERLLVAGPFSFFGDPEMLREIGRALAE